MTATLGSVHIYPAYYGNISVLDWWVISGNLTIGGGSISTTAFILVGGNLAQTNGTSPDLNVFMYGLGTISLSAGFSIANLGIFGMNLALTEIVVTNYLQIDGFLDLSAHPLNLSSTLDACLEISGSFVGDIYLNGSSPTYYLVISSPMGGGFVHFRNITTFASFGLRVEPIGCEVSVSTDHWDGTSPIWNMSADSPFGLVNLRISILPQFTQFKLMVDNSWATSFWSDKYGYASLNYSGPWSLHRFSIEVTSQRSWSPDPLPEPEISGQSGSLGILPVFLIALIAALFVLLILAWPRKEGA
jgi:hypothetical protein